MNSSRLISVVVPTLNRGRSIERTITSILRNLPLPLELIVADQSDPEQAELTRQTVERSAREAGLSMTSETSDATVSDGAALPGQIRYVRCVSRGAGANRNAGAKLATGSIVLFTDDDTEVAPDWVVAVEREFVENPSIVGIYGQILTSEVSGEQNQKRTGIELTRTGPRVVNSQPTLPWKLGSGANMAFRRDALLACGGFDEVMTIGAPLRAFEDLDLGHRILVQGRGHISFCPESVVEHHNPKSFREQRMTEIGYGIGAGAAYVKYRRCAYPGASKMLRAWIWEMGIRRSGAGIFKWRSVRVLQLGLIQLWAPLLGIVLAWRRPIDTQHCLFR